MRREQAEATKGQLIEVATRLFAERGYEGTSIETVLAAAGVSRGALYHHFRNKEALFEAVYEAAEAAIAAEVIAESASASTPAEMLRAGASGWLRRTREPVVRRITLIDAPSVLGWERWREIDERHFLGAVRTVLGDVLGPDVAPERVDLLAHMLLAALGEVAMVLARGDQSDEEMTAAQAAVEDLLTRLIT